MIADTRPASISTQSTLVDRARRGDTVAFEGLLRDRLDGLFRAAWGITGNEADARDATQDACLSAWRQLPRLRDVEAFDVWLNRVLLNSCRMLLRKRRQVREVAITPAHDRVGPSANEPERFDDADAIARALDRLDPDARALLVLHHLRHEPVARIAASLGIPVGTVKWRLHAARNALEAALAGERP
ncbi:MAG: RNA polymerase sigma factor [Candidatus Limnocylindrales bacterium]